MNLFILDESFKSIYLLDSFQSLIWTERYIGAGDFEIYTPINEYVLQIVKFIQDKLSKRLDTYIWLLEAESAMIVDTVSLSSDVEAGGIAKISGYSLEYLINRRIIWNQTILNGNLQNAVKKLLNENVIAPSIADRRIPNFIFVDSTDKKVTDLKLEAQYTGNNLYETLVSICKDRNLGFRVTLNDANQFEFRLYFGTDRSYDQLENPYVVFSKKFENIINSNYLESIRTLKNVTLVAGEDQGQNRKTRIVGSGVGLSRREMYTDARDIQTETEEGELTPEEYNAQLDQRGSEKLSENIYTKTFEGEVEGTNMFKYGVDFFKGDIVQIQTEYGIESKVRVSEVVRSYDRKGYNLYPTFEIIPEETT